MFMYELSGSRKELQDGECEETPADAVGGVRYTNEEHVVPHYFPRRRVP